MRVKPAQLRRYEEVILMTLGSGSCRHLKFVTLLLNCSAGEGHGVGSAETATARTGINLPWALLWWIPLALVSDFAAGFESPTKRFIDELLLSFIALWHLKAFQQLPRNTTSTKLFNVWRCDIACSLHFCFTSAWGSSPASS
jgi:hypothetical protein